MTETRIEFDVLAEMRDGTVLADVSATWREVADADCVWERPERPVLTFIDSTLRLESKNINIEACRNKSLR